MKQMTLNENGNVGPAIVFIFAIICIGMTWFILTPIFNSLASLLNSQVASGFPVSQSRFDSMALIMEYWPVMLIILVFIVGAWYLSVSKREEGGWV
jgi:H+/Cl- antiporter ClcA